MRISTNLVRVSVHVVLFLGNYFVGATRNSTTTKATTTDLCETPQNNHCEYCVKNTDILKCYWCPTTSSCHSYDILPDGCGLQWYLGQCSLKGYWLVIIAPCVGMLALMILCCCCWCCYCRPDKATDEERLVLNSRRAHEKQKRQQFFEVRDYDHDYGSSDSNQRTNYGLFNRQQPY